MKVNGADGYKVYFSSCNTNDSYETCRLVKIINNNNTFKYTKSSLKKGNLYKAYVSAFKSVNGKKVEIGKSLLMHSVTGNKSKKYTNPKAITVTNEKLSVEVGRKVKITGQKLTKHVEKLELLKHDAKYRYLSSNKNIATVSKNGTITGKSKGTCKIHIIALNGVNTTIRVTVR